ncbi:MAG: hypothetical protein US72_C0002G0033 [Microgenomates group bacterium GW2011_GWC1_38_12]|uniref:Right handed beta helix domain-containing protein n=1 Tax=Candidatus Vogelbacteria bacterium RIFOXYB1_FULL_42_16 TaxID=1802436 RepID=A0A1G2QEX7_9BACT|nr:MAG: hypothetical protein US72_C0002G0033 [Microgenomates group bacterium GW2011_GWC1_38_12]KKS78139.1 MAG: hypothetical protein UV50_C0001G0049 [Parcubacteria group bacterium GW2011_GWB1_42_9]OHA59134.1 MAG: hypothetical protein A2370_03035 [Candidatus Vogelbacteria bacterium RIFOXYB1_FULL_42_16]
MSLARRKRKKLILTIITISILVLVFLFPLAYHYRIVLIRHPLVAQLVPLYRSLIKFPDLLFLPRYAFFDSQLETYKINISIKDIRRLDMALPVPFSGGELEDDNKVWVSADFKTDDYQDRVKIRYRGTIANHWNSYKKSFLVKFPKDHLFKGMRELNLVIPDDRLYFIEPLNNYRAKKLDLIVPDSSNVKVSINGVDHGVYLVFEHWTQEWLEKQPVSNNSLILGIGQSIVGTSTSSIFTPEGIVYWNSWNSDAPDLDAVKALNEIISKTDDETFKKLIPHLVSIDEILAFNVVSMLSGEFHGAGDSPSGANNTMMVFDKLIGKFRPIPYNVAISDLNNSYKEMPTSLERRILAIPEWKEDRDRLLKDYLNNNKEDDLRFIESWISKYNNDFLADQSKLSNNLTYLKDINQLKKMVKFYQDEALKHLNDKYPLIFIIKEPLNLPVNFNYLFQVALSPEQFVKQNPEFSLNDSGLVLESGFHYFFRTIIIPAKTKLTIMPGAVLVMGPKVSFVSYSPIQAIGTAVEPIKILPASLEPWGNFVVIDTGRQKNTFDRIFISTGSESTVNGIFISGTLSFHGSDVKLTNSFLENAQGDDTLNIKSAEGIVVGNTFVSNSSDAVDLDFPGSETIIENNEFFNNGGDAVDLSWSDVLIKNNIMIGSGDKGISVGERSHPIIIGNLIAKNVIGVAIKDLSTTTMDSNIIIKNKIGLAAYEKKEWFGGGQAYVKNGVLWGNENEIQKDELSKIDISNSVVRTKPVLLNWPKKIRDLIE